MAAPNNGRRPTDNYPVADPASKARNKQRKAKVERERKDVTIPPECRDDEYFRELWEEGYEYLPIYGFDNLVKAPIDADWNEYARGYQNPTRTFKPDGKIQWNESGAECDVTVNFHQIAKLSTDMKACKVHQYDIVITGGSGVERRGLIRALWESKMVRDELGDQFIWNGDKIAWSAFGVPALNKKKVPIDQQQHVIRINLGKPRQLSDKDLQQKAADARYQTEVKDNQFYIQVRYAKTLDLSCIFAYLDNRIDYGENVMEAITMLNHLIRHTPASRMNAIKNTFFPKNLIENQRYDLGQGVYALRGAFQSIRMAQGGIGQPGPGKFPAGRLMLNVDVSNAVFYRPDPMSDLANLVLGTTTDTYFLSMVGKNQPGGEHHVFKDSVSLAKLKVFFKRVNFKVDYPGVSDLTKNRRWVVADLSYHNSNTWKFPTEKWGMVNVRQYYKKAYGLDLVHPGYPLVQTQKEDVLYPMEVCWLQDGQRFPYKLDERQTTDMIRFAVSRPPQRMKAIKEGLSHLNWAGDPILNAYNIRINPNMQTTKARVLTPPKVMLGGNHFESPKFSGRWSVYQKKFLRPGKPLKYWGVCVLTGLNGKSAVSQQEVTRFMNQFVAIYQGHGGTVINAHPVTVEASESNTAVACDLVMEKLRGKGMSAAQYPDLLFFILPRKNGDSYNRLKRSCDLKYGVMSQCVQAGHVKKCAEQYISNVLLKVNAKLGGQSYQSIPVEGPGRGNGNFFKGATMIIGADVSHPAPGSLGPSMCAMTCSMDTQAIRYGARVQSNGHRLEMIATWNWHDMLGPLASEWIRTVGKGQLPEHIYYFRDGVSEGQYEHVVQQEVRDIRSVFKSLDSPSGAGLKNLKITVVICSKRHHIRFFPRQGSVGCDQNGNPVPGVLVERDVTSTKHFDFYLNSHSAIQGTARPTHYAVIMDQANVPPSVLENMVYAHCYQYIRSTTPVSLFPAVYYAHLASKRAICHERDGLKKKHERSSEQRERYMLMRARAEADITGKIMTEEAMAKLKKYTLEEYPPTVPTCHPEMWNGMWYI